MQTEELQTAGGSPVIIRKYAILPSDIALAARGKVLLTGFAGKTAYAWVMSHPDAPEDMQLLTIPSEKIVNIQTDPLFESPEHVGSFFITDSSKLLPSAWHVFMFMPKSKGAIILPN